MISANHDNLCKEMAERWRELPLPELKIDFKEFGFCYHDDSLPLNPLLLERDQAQKVARDIRRIIALARNVAMEPIELHHNTRPDHLELVQRCKDTNFLPPIARPDAVLVNGQLKLLELNTDSGIGLIQEMSRIQCYLSQCPSLTSMRNADPLATQIEFISTFAQAYGKTRTDCRIAIVIYRHFEEYFVSQSRLLADKLSELPRISATVCYPDELMAHDAVTDGKVEFDVLYRDGSPMHEANLFSDMNRIMMLAAGTRTLILSDPKDLAVEDKGVLATLSERAEHGDLSDADRALIQRYVPWTRRVSSLAKEVPACMSTWLEYLISHKDRYVLKRIHSHTSKHVHMGRATSHYDWANLLKQAFSDSERWIVQEYQSSDSALFAFVREGTCHFDQRQLSMSPFVFGADANSWLVCLKQNEDDLDSAWPMARSIGMAGVIYQ